MRYTLPLLVLLALLLSACAGGPSTAPALSSASTPDTSATLSAIVSATLASAKTEVLTNTPIPALPTTPTVITASDNLPTGEDLTRTDSQGAVEVDITPSNLTDPGDSLDFEVGLNTHSVNLNMDIAKLATLKTDTGLSVRASSWNGENGGHHVSGTLTFPAQVNGIRLTEGVKVLTLVIQNVDAPERTFTWQINH